MDVPFTVLIVNSATKDNVTYYLLKIQQDEDEEMNYAVDRRFTDFVDLDERLRMIYGAYVMDQLTQIPKKTLIRQSSDAFVKKRHYDLQQYLHGIHEIPYLVQSKTYRQFLKMDSFFPSTIPIRPFLKFVQNKSQHGIRLSNFNMIMLSHNVFISISGCHPEIVFCSPERIQSIQHKINQNHASYKASTNKTKTRHKKCANKYLNTSEEPQYTPSSSGPLLSSSHHSPSPLLSSPLSGRIGSDLTNTPSSSMLPSPNEWGGCIQIWYYDATAMKNNASSGNFSWWLEERGDDNKNFYGWNQSQHNSHNNNNSNDISSTPNATYATEPTMDYYSYYGGADDLPTAQHEIQQQTHSHPNHNNHSECHNTHKHTKRKRIKEVHRELDCIFLNEVPSSLHYDRQHQQLFVGTLMGNIHRFKIIHNAKIEATGILPNPNIYNNVSNIHSYCHSSIYTYAHHEAFATKEKEDTKHVQKQQRIHQRLYEQRELLKLKDRQNHHKKIKKKMALIPDNDAIYNKAILNMVSYGGVLYVSDASSNIHAFDIHEFKHLHYLSLDHYFVDILQTEYRVHVDEYYKKRLNQYRAQHERMMFKSNEPKDIHSDPIIPSFYPQDDVDDAGGGLFSAAFLRNRNKKTNVLDVDMDDEDATEDVTDVARTLDAPMRIGGVTDTAYEMYFDELVFSTTITKQKHKILNVTNKLNQDIIATDLIQFEDNLFIPTNLPYLTLQYLRYPSEFNMVRPEISKTAVLEAKIQNNAIIIDEKDTKKQAGDHEEDMSYSNPYKTHRKKRKDEWTVIPNKREKEGMGCDNIFGTVSNFDANSDVIYSIPTIHAIHTDFLIYDDERIRASAQRTDNTNDMAIYNQCTIFVWAFTTHISVHETPPPPPNEAQLTEFAAYDPWHDHKPNESQKSGKKKPGKKRKGNTIKERTWHLKSKWFDKTVDHMCKQLSALTYCPSIRTLAVAGITGYIALFNQHGTCFNIFFAHTDTITKMIWLDDCKQLVSTGLDGTIKIWNLYHSEWIKHTNHILIDDDEDEIITHEEADTLHHINTQSPPHLNKDASRSPEDISPYKDIARYEEPEREISNCNPLADLDISDDEDLADLYKSKTDYDPFGDKAFDDYLDKRGQSLKEKEENFYKPTKPPKHSVSSKELFATQSVLSHGIQTGNSAPISTKSKGKSGFKTMKVKNTHKVSTASLNNIDAMDINNMDDMADIESYIAQQNEHNSAPDQTPDVSLATSFDLLDPHSSPEPQRNCSFHVVKKTKPKKRKKKKKEERDGKKEKRDKKKKKKRRKKADMMEPEDCTIRYDNKERKYRDMITKKFYSKSTKATNPFTMDEERLDEEPASATNPFAEDLQSTNPFHESATTTANANSTNPFCDDLP